MDFKALKALKGSILLSETTGALPTELRMLQLKPRQSERNANAPTTAVLHVEGDQNADKLEAN